MSAAAAAPASGELYVAADRLVDGIVEDVERRQADVGDFFLTKRDFVERPGSP
jgi:hypothetical protein